MQEIKKNDLLDSCIEVEDSTFDLEPVIINKTYTIKDSIFVQVNDSKIIVYSRNYSIKELLSVVNEINKEYNSPIHVMLFYSVVNCKWSSPTCRQPRNFNIVKLTEPMQRVYDDVAKIFTEKEKYEVTATPYRRGYCLVGESEKGKSLMVEIIAYAHGMCIYRFNLNNKDIDDSILEKLIGDVPPYSIILFEEIDKQFLSLKESNITIGALLTALDGPMRLDDGTIVIFTANENVFDNNFIHEGRIDIVINF